MEMIQVEKGKVGLDTHAKVRGYENGLELAVQYYGDNENVPWDYISQWHFLSKDPDSKPVEIEESEIKSMSKGTVVLVQGHYHRWYDSHVTLYHTDNGIYMSYKEYLKIY